jgi:ABC-type glycerol-3-phosphate transport system substrate-binding protein
MRARGRISRRDFLRASAGGAAAALVAACIPVASPAAEEQGAAPMEAVELSISHWWGNAFSEGSNALAVFEEKTGIKVVEDQAGGGNEKMLLQFAAGTAPDALMMNSPGNAPFFREGLLLPVDDALAAQNVDNTKWATDQLLENGYKGKIMGLSLFPMQTIMIYANKGLVEETGIELPVWGDSTKDASSDFDTWTWDDLLELGRRATKRRDDGTVEQWGLDASWGGLGSFWDHWKYPIYDLGGTEFDDAWGYEETECLINSPECAQAIQRHVDLILKENVTPTPEASSGIEGGLFRAGKLTAVWSYSGAHIFPPDEISFEQIYISFPWDKRRAMGVGANYWAVNKDAQNLDAAFTWTILDTTDWDLLEEQMPFSLAPYDTQTHLEQLPAGPYREAHLITLSRTNMSACAQCTENVVFYPRWTGGRNTIFGREMSAALGKIYLEEMTVQEALDDVKAKVDVEIQENMAKESS